ncbi:MAG: hypothetical protein ACOCWG_05575 [bacterium]
MKVYADINTMGNTQFSLEKLRDILASKYKNILDIVEIPTSNITCGFLVVDQDTNEAIFSGDGFRTDHGGEGGSGYKKAQIFMEVMGVEPNMLAPQIDIDHKLFIGKSESEQCRALASMLKKHCEPLFDGMKAYVDGPK